MEQTLENRAQALAESIRMNQNSMIMWKTKRAGAKTPALLFVQNDACVLIGPALLGVLANKS